MAVSLRERPVLRGSDARRFLLEEKKINDRRAQLLKRNEQTQVKDRGSKKAVRLCVTK